MRKVLSAFIFTNKTYTITGVESNVSKPYDNWMSCLVADIS